MEGDQINEIQANNDVFVTDNVFDNRDEVVQVENIEDVEEEVGEVEDQVNVQEVFKF